MTDKHKSKKELENEGKETVEIFQDLDQTALKTEMFIEKYAKQIGIIFGAVVLAVLGYFAYQQFIANPKNEEATLSYLAAQKNLSEGKDDIALGGKSAANRLPANGPFSLSSSPLRYSARVNAFFLIHLYYSRAGGRSQAKRRRWHFSGSSAPVQSISCFLQKCLLAKYIPAQMAMASTR
jgi:hypothetical protein